MRVRGDAARLGIDAIGIGAVVWWAVLATLPVALLVIPLSQGDRPGAVFTLIVLGLALIAVRAPLRRSRLTLDRAAGEMVLMRRGEEIRAPLSDLRGVRIQDYVPRIRRTGGTAAARGMRRAVLVLEGREEPFAFGYSGGRGPERVAEAVNGWLGVEVPDAAPGAEGRRAATALWEDA